MLFNYYKKDQPCLNCGAVLLSKARLDEASHPSVNNLPQIELQQVEDELYIKCQKCGAKNCVELDTGPDGLPLLRITHLVP